MAKAKKKTSKKAAVKKKWVTILAPKMFNQQVIGDTNVYDTREGIGKPLKVNLMTLTRNPKAQGINVSFVVTGQHDGKLLTTFTGFRVMPSVVRRMVRRGKDKIEDSFTCLTSDGKKVRIKPIVVTKAKAKGSVLTSLRKLLRQHLVRVAAKTTYETLANDIIERKLQKTIFDALSKTYPVINCEIRWFQLLSKDIKHEVPEESAPPEEPEKKAYDKEEEPVPEEPKKEAPKKKKEEKESAEAEA